MKVTIGTWRKRDGKWERIEGSVELDIVQTDDIDDFIIKYPADILFLRHKLPKEEGGTLNDREVGATLKAGVRR